MKTVSVLSLKDRIRKRTDQENSSFISDDELLEYINSAYAEFYGLLTTIYEDYNISTSDFLTVDGANMYNLPSNFFKLTGVDFDADTDNVQDVLKFQFNERNNISQPFYYNNNTLNLRYRLLADSIVFLPAPPAGHLVRLWYIPSAPNLTFDTQLIDGINGYEEMIITEVAIKIMAKQEQDATPFLIQKKAVMTRITEEAPSRDAGKPSKVGDSRGLESNTLYPWNRR